MTEELRELDLQLGKAHAEIRLLKADAIGAAIAQQTKETKLAH